MNHKYYLIYIISVYFLHNVSNIFIYHLK